MIKYKVFVQFYKKFQIENPTIDNKLPEIVFLSDIHANLDALDAVSKSLARDRIFCSGDIIGYGANPNEVTEWMIENNVQSVMGNHEHALITNEVSWFNWNAQRAILWTRSRLKIMNMEFLRNLPKLLEFEINGIKFLVVHGSPNNPISEYVLPQSHEDLFDYYLTNNNVDVICLGHTHIPFKYKSDKGIVFNPGSVGQPRSRDPRASYAICHIEGRDLNIEHKLVWYDIDSAAKKIIEADLPRFFAERLYLGI